jgi:transcriptional regulator with XRE-family HTH domain
MTEQLGATLVRLRQRKGYSQLRVAEGLCGASGVTTVTRHEISRWERQERIPSAFWLRWLAEVLEVPMTELEAAAAETRKGARAPLPSALTATAASAGNGAWMPRTVRQAAAATRKDNDPLSRVTIEFEHQTTSVRLSATYDDPRRAVSAIEVFPSMVGDDEPVRVQPGRVQAGAQPAGPAVPVARQQPSASAALTASKSAEVPMGIRYTRGPESP